MNKVLLLIIILIIISNLKKSENYNNIFNKITLPENKLYINKPIKEYGNVISVDIYNNLLNLNNPFFKNKNLKSISLFTYIIDKCYCKSKDEVLSIIDILNKILKDKFSNNELIKGNITIKEYFVLIKNLKKNLLNDFFNKNCNNLIKQQINNFNMVKNYIIDLIIDVNINEYNEYKIKNAILLYLHEKNIFSINNDEKSEQYNYLLLYTEESINDFTKQIFSKNFKNILNLRLVNIKNILNSGELYDYFSKKKNLCYI